MSTILDDLRTIISQNVMSRQDLDFLIDKVEDYALKSNFA